MSSRMMPLLRLLIVVAVVGIVVVSGALVKAVITRSPSDTTPRTEAQRAIIAAQEAVRANPNDESARIKLAAAFLEQGSVSEAIDQARIAARLKPSDPSPYYVLGLAESRSGQNKAAIADLTKAGTMTGQLAPFYQDVYVALAHAQEADGNGAQAIISMDKALTYGSTNAPLFIERGQMYERQQKFFDAAVDYATALEYLPNATDARSALEAIKKDHPQDYNKAIAVVASTYAGQHPAGKNTTLTVP